MAIRPAAGSFSLAVFLALAAMSGVAMLPAPAAAASFDPGRMPAIRYGSRGPAVITFQSALNEWRARHARAAIAVDGDFGPKTRTAAVDFQWANGLYPDGVVGPLTWRALAAFTVPGGGTTTPSGGPPRSAEALRQEAAWSRAGMPGRYSVTDMSANGGRPVAVWLPAGFDASRSVRVLTYFHGHGGDAGTTIAANGVLTRLADLGRRHPDTVFVCVQAASAPFSYWMLAPRESFSLLEQQGLAEAQRLAQAGRSLTVRQRIVSAHSGGGLALKNAVVAGTFRADRIELLDSAYGDWAQVVTRWALAQPAGSRPLIEAWHTPGSTTTNDLAIARMAPALVTVHSSPVSHGAIPGRFLGTALDQ